MTDNLAQTIPTPLELRAMLEAMVRADLLGPAGGPKEIVDERNVRDRHIVGRLAMSKTSWPSAGPAVTTRTARRNWACPRRPPFTPLPSV